MVCHVSLGQLTIRAALARPVSQQRVTLNKINSHYSLATHTHTHTHTQVLPGLSKICREIFKFSALEPQLLLFQLSFPWPEIEVKQEQ